MQSAAEVSCKQVQLSCKRVQSRSSSGYAVRSRKCQEIELAHIAERSRKSQRKGQEKCVYMNQCQDKTNPSLVTGLRCKLYTRNPFEYRQLCELVLDWRVLRGNKCVTRARGNIFQPFPRRGQTLIYMHLFLTFSLRLSLRFSAAKNRALRGQIKWTIAEHTAYSQTIQRRNVWNPSCGCKVHRVPLQEQLWGIP